MIIAFLDLFFIFVSLNFVPILCASHWSHNNSYAPFAISPAISTTHRQVVKQTQRGNYLYHLNEEYCKVSAMIRIDGIQIDVHYILDMVFF